MSTHHYDDSINTVAHNLPSTNLETLRVIKQTQGVVKMVKSKMDSTITDLRKERGQRIYNLYKSYPILEKITKSRTPTDNQLRAEIWNTIMEKINDEFGESIDVMSLENTKKLADYWKQRLDSPPLSSQLDLLPLLHNILFNIPFPTPPISPTVTQTEHLDTEHLDTLSTELEHMQDARKVLLKEHRLRFIVNATWQMMRAIGLEDKTRSRSNEFNIRRTKMWVELTKLVNKKFHQVLAPIQLDQVKKAFSNFRRRHEDTYDWTYIGSAHPELLKYKQQVHQKNEEIVLLKLIILQGKHFYHRVPPEQQAIDIVNFRSENWKFLKNQ